MTGICGKEAHLPFLELGIRISEPRLVVSLGSARRETEFDVDVNRVIEISEV